MANADAIAEAVALVTDGMSANQAASKIAEEHGVTRRTVQRWCTEAGQPLGKIRGDSAESMREVEAKGFAARREQLKVDLLDSALALVSRVSDAKDSDVNKVAVAVGIMVDKMRLEMGEATDRREHLNFDAIDQEIRRLEADIAANPPTAGG